MMTYRIKPEYLTQWGDNATEETVLTWDDIEMITHGWGKTPADVMDQLIIQDENGVYWEAIANLMDDEIREDLHISLAPCSEDEFLEEYKKRHLEKFGEEFTY